MKIITLCGNSKSGKDTVAEYISKNHKYFPMALSSPIKGFLKSVFGFDDTQLYGPGVYRDMIDARFHDYDCEAWKVAIKKTQEVGWDKYKNRQCGTLIDFLRSMDLIQNNHINHYGTLKSTIEQLREDHTALSPRIALQVIGTDWGRNQVDKDLWVSYCLKNIQRCSYLIAPRKNYKYIITDIRFQNEFDRFKEHQAFSIKINRPDLEIMEHASETELLSFDDKQFDVVIDNDGSLEDLYAKVDEALKNV